MLTDIPGRDRAVQRLNPVKTCVLDDILPPCYSSATGLSQRAKSDKFRPSSSLGHAIRVTPWTSTGHLCPLSVDCAALNESTASNVLEDWSVTITVRVVVS